MARIQKVLSAGVQFDSEVVSIPDLCTLTYFFKLIRAEDPNTTKSWQNDNVNAAGSGFVSF